MILMQNTTNIWRYNRNNIPFFFLDIADIFKNRLYIITSQNRIIEADILSIVPINTDIIQTGILIAFEFEYGVIHKGTIENA